MGTITVKVSDLTGERFEPDEAVARIVVEQHPDFDEQITLEVKPEEIEGKLPAEREEFVVISYYLHEEPEPRRFLLSRSEFEDLFENANSDEVLKHALAVQQEERQRQQRGRRRGGRRQGTERRERIDYASPEHAGEPHPGRITEAEKAYVRDHLDEVNARLRSQGRREIDPSDPMMAERYGLSPREETGREEEITEPFAGAVEVSGEEPEADSEAGGEAATPPV
jgi:hypothetical protein